MNNTYNKMTPQEKYNHLYKLLAFGSGIFFIIVLLGFSILFPTPTLAQSRIWIAVLALSGGAFSTVLKGTLDVNASFMRQITIGAGGAFAIFVILYFFNPAVF